MNQVRRLVHGDEVKIKITRSIFVGAVERVSGAVHIPEIIAGLLPMNNGRIGTVLYRAAAGNLDGQRIGKGGWWRGRWWRTRSAAAASSRNEPNQDEQGSAD